MVGVVPRKLDRLILLHIRRLFDPAPAVEKKKNKVDIRDKTIWIPIMVLSEVEDAVDGVSVYLILHKYLDLDRGVRKGSVGRFQQGKFQGSEEECEPRPQKSQPRPQLSEMQCGGTFSSVTKSA
jgi:hypothetical protein